MTLDQLLTEPHYRSTADSIGEAIRSEDGTGQAIQTLERIALTSRAERVRRSTAPLYEDDG